MSSRHQTRENIVYPGWSITGTTKSVNVTTKRVTVGTKETSRHYKNVTVTKKRVTVASKERNRHYKYINATTNRRNKVRSCRKTKNKNGTVTATKCREQKISVPALTSVTKKLFVLVLKKLKSFAMKESVKGGVFRSAETPKQSREQYDIKRQNSPGKKLTSDTHRTHDRSPHEGARSFFLGRYIPDLFRSTSYRSFPLDDLALPGQMIYVICVI